jgi:hypothetical protein
MVVGIGPEQALTGPLKIRVPCQPSRGINFVSKNSVKPA